MNEQMQHEILSRLDALAAKLGVAAQNLFQLYVRQTKIDGIECVVGFLVLGVGSYFCGRAAYLRSKDDSDDAGSMGFWCVLLVVGSIPCLVGAIDLLGNPNLWAFKSLLDTIK